MGSSAALEAQKKPSTTFATQLLENGQHPALDQRAHDSHEPLAMHDFADVSLNQTRTQTCPLAAPRTCPFGGACHTCPTHVQAKLEVGRPDDEYEREADEIADKVMRMPEPCCSGRPDRDEKEKIHLKPLSSSSAGIAVSPEVEAQIQSLRSSGGQPLSDSERAFFEPRFGQDFGRVRLHYGLDAAGAAKAVSARAFTVGQNVVFGAGNYRPRAPEGCRLMAHELAHASQQATADRRTAPADHSVHGPGCEPRPHLLVRRTACDHPDRSFYQTSEDYCRDTGFSGALHPGQTCYREIPRRKSYWECPPGKHVCFDSTGKCDSHVDKSSPVEGRNKDKEKTCNLHAMCAAWHGVTEAAPAVAADIGRGLQKALCQKVCVAGR